MSPPGEEIVDLWDCWKKY